MQILFIYCTNFLQIFKINVQILYILSKYCTVHYVNIVEYCSYSIKILNNNCANNVQKWCAYIVEVEVLCKMLFKYIQIIQEYCSNIVQVLYKYLVNVVEMYFKFCRNILQSMWEYCTFTVQIMFKNCTNIAQRLPKDCINKNELL